MARTGQSSVTGVSTAILAQRSEEWFEARKGKITGSRIGAALGLNPYVSRDQLMEELVAEMLGEPPAFSGNAATAWGEAHEPIALRSCRLRSNNRVAEAGFIPHVKHSFLGYSPDGIIQQTTLNSSGVPVAKKNVGVLEIKCPYSQSIPASLPDHYWAQVQLGMEVLDVDHCDFLYWTPSRTHLRKVDRDRDWWQSVLPDLQAFDINLKTRLAKEETSQLRRNND